MVAKDCFMGAREPSLGAKQRFLVARKCLLGAKECFLQPFIGARECFLGTSERSIDIIEFFLVPRGISCLAGRFSRVARSVTWVL